MASSALGLARTNAQAMKGELKGMDTLFNLSGGPVVTTTNTNNFAVPLNLVQQGTGSWNRVGRKIHMKSLRLRGIANCVSGAATVTANVTQGPLRMVVVLDRQTNGGAIPTWDTIFGTTDQTGAETSNMMAGVRYDATDRFKVLKDCVMLADRVTYIPAAEGTEALYNGEVTFDEYIKLSNIETLFGGQSSPLTIADIQSGSVLVYFRTNTNTTDNYWVVKDSCHARLRFRD